MALHGDRPSNSENDTPPFTGSKRAASPPTPSASKRVKGDDEKSARRRTASTSRSTVEVLNTPSIGSSQPPTSASIGVRSPTGEKSVAEERINTPVVAPDVSGPAEHPIDSGEVSEPSASLMTPQKSPTAGADPLGEGVDGVEQSNARAGAGPASDVDVEMGGGEAAIGQEKGE